VGKYCDICGTKDEHIKNVEIKCISEFDRNHNYIFEEKELCRCCYMEMYNEIKKVLKKY